MKRTPKSRTRLALTACATLIIHPAQAAPADPLAKYNTLDTAGLTQVRGPTYANPNYGYAIRIPQGQTGWQNTAPSPNHGIAITLGEHRLIEVDASFDAAERGSTAAAAQDATNFVNGAHNTQTTDTLGNRSAERIMQTWLGSDRRRIVLVRRDSSGGPDDAIVFTLSLATTQAAYEQDKRTFDTMVNSFRFIPRN